MNNEESNNRSSLYNLFGDVKNEEKSVGLKGELYNSLFGED
jgi:hypothetical protein